MYTYNLVTSICIDLSKIKLFVFVFTTDFLSSKVKFIHTSTVTRSHSCYGKNCAYASRTSCCCK